MRTTDLCRLAAHLAAEHGICAMELARRATVSLEMEGQADGAQFWQSLSALLDDIFTRRLDPERPLTIH